MTTDRNIFQFSADGKFDLTDGAVGHSVRDPETGRTGILETNRDGPKIRYDDDPKLFPGQPIWTSLAKRLVAFSPPAAHAAAEPKDTAELDAELAARGRTAMEAAPDLGERLRLADAYRVDPAEAHRIEAAKRELRTSRLGSIGRAVTGGAPLPVAASNNLEMEARISRLSTIGKAARAEARQ